MNIYLQYSWILFSFSCYYCFPVFRVLIDLSVRVSVHLSLHRYTIERIAPICRWGGIYIFLAWVKRSVIPTYPWWVGYILFPLGSSDENTIVAWVKFSKFDKNVFMIVTLNLKSCLCDRPLCHKMALCFFCQYYWWFACFQVGYNIYWYRNNGPK